jgi:hypothetical protein
MQVFFIIGLMSVSGCVFAQSQNIFFKDAEPKHAQRPAYTEADKPLEPATTTVHVDAASTGIPVSKYVYGNNANTYMTQMVDQPTLLNYIKLLSPNVLRFPGGNLSSLYFWNATKNQPPPDAPTRILDGEGKEINPNYWYGMNTDSYSITLDNYYKMLELTNSTGIITVNYGYARYGTSENPVAQAAHLAAEWVRKDNGRTKFWEIGNESNGNWQAGFRIDKTRNEDGQPEIITGATYGQHFKVFADSMRKAAAEIKAEIFIGAQMLAEEPASWWNDTDRYWNSGVLNSSKDHPDFYIIHSYYTPYQKDSRPEEILASATSVTKSLVDVVNKAMDDAKVTRKPIAMTEYNIFAEGSRQQASMINGIHAAIVMGETILNNYSLVCRWNLANGWANGNDHGTFSKGDVLNDPLWNPRAVYYYLYYFQKYFGDTMVTSTVSGDPEVLAYASRFSSGETGMVLINKSSDAETVNVSIRNFAFGDRYYFYTLTPGTEGVDFPLKVSINGSAATYSVGGPANFESIKARSSLVEGGIKISIPARSVIYLLVESSGDPVTGVAEKRDDQKTSVEIFPNPTERTTRVKLSSSGFDRLSIIDLKGREVLSKELQRGVREFEIDHVLQKGTYIFRLMRKSQHVDTKIVVK